MQPSVTTHTIGFSLPERDTKQVISCASRIFEDKDYWVMTPTSSGFRMKNGMNMLKRRLWRSVPPEGPRCELLKVFGDPARS
jgi:hypothetical protein